MVLKKKTYSVKNIVAATFMIITLLWLTVSIHFVSTARQEQKMFAKANAANQDIPDSEESNPFSNNTEEKAPTAVNPFAEEFLHHTGFSEHHFLIHISHNNSGDVATYTAFHGELLSPPPDL